MRMNISEHATVRQCCCEAARGTGATVKVRLGSSRAWGLVQLNCVVV